MHIDQLIRSRRKTVALIVERDGQLTVRAPLRLSLARIQEMVEQKADWVRRKQAQSRAASPTSPPRQFAVGETFLFLGQPYPLEIVPRAADPLQFEELFLLDQRAIPRARDIFTNWYKSQARAIFTERANEYARRFGFSFDRLRISSARTRWGSCSSRATLSFTWRLVMAPPDIVDYVIVHELAHLREKNHSAAFWAVVQAILPDYKTRRKWLKTNGGQLTLD